MQIYSVGSSLFCKTPRGPQLVATRDPRRTRAALVAQGCTAAAADAITAGVAVLTDPFPMRDWMFNREEVQR